MKRHIRLRWGGSMLAGLSALPLSPPTHEANRRLLLAFYNISEDTLTPSNPISHCNPKSRQHVSLNSQ